MLNTKLNSGKMRFLDKAKAGESISSGHGITVQELFRSVPEDDLAEAYLWFSPPFIPYERLSIDEKMKQVRLIRNHIRTFLHHLCTCCPEKESLGWTLFVTGYHSCDYDEKDREDLIAFVANDADIVQSMTEAPEKWESEYPYDKTYGIEFASCEKVAGYKVAEVSRETLSPLTICSVILEELCFWGSDYNQREIRIEEVRKELKEAVSYSQEHPESLIPERDVFTRLQQEMYDSLQTEDERQHYRLEEEFREKVKDIEQRWIEQRLKENLEISRKTLVKEYQACFTKED